MRGRVTDAELVNPKEGLDAFERQVDALCRELFPEKEK